MASLVKSRGLSWQRRLLVSAVIVSLSCVSSLFYYLSALFLTTFLIVHSALLSDIGALFHMRGSNNGANDDIQRF